MCGICGVFNSIAPNISEMLKVLEHRGHDSNGFYSDDICTLGHQRLAILDLSDKGKQPMWNEDGTVCLVVNGEIYNYKSLRNELKSQGHSFKSESDSEVIVHLYEQHGESFVDRLSGMFALAIYDRREDKLILARDPIGKKPLYYFIDGYKIVFASEIKAIFKAGVSCEANYNVIPSYLMYQYTIGSETLFKGIHKLPAGSMIVATKDSFRLSKYWEMSDKNRAKSNGDYSYGLLKLLED
jgi:asparagine synthase (glutamine-hydrolysing)